MSRILKATRSILGSLWFQLLLLAAVIVAGALGYWEAGVLLGAFPNNCDGRIIAVDPSTGCTLTRATIRGMTPQDFEDQGVKEVGMDKIITRAKEARVAGVTEHTLETLLTSRMAPIKKSLQQANIGGNESVILPYIYRRQRRNINSNYFIVDAGVAAPTAGSNGIPASAWDITVKKSNSPFSTSLPNLERYFLPGKYVYVMWYDSTTKVARSTQLKVITVANADAGGVFKAKITAEPNVNATTWAGYSAGQKAPYQPDRGILINLANSVSDFESWCYNDVAENTNKLLTFWLQTSRETHQYNDEYLKALNAALVSGYFKDFRQLPLAEQKRLQHMKYRRDWYNSVFYGQRINDKQAVETYRDLPQVIDPTNPNCTLEYKSNALGFMTQLEDCARVLDYTGNPLNLDSLAQTGYELMRSRQADGTSVDTIDVMTDRFTAGQVLQIMTTFYKAKYGIETHRYYQVGQELKHENVVMLKYNIYQLPPDLGGFNLAVFTDPYFDDMLTAFTASVDGAAPTGDQANRGRNIWGIDWSDLEVGIAGSSSVQRQTNVADNLYNCIIKPNVSHYMLNSTMWTAILQDPARHHISRNFSDAAPILTVPAASV